MWVCLLWEGADCGALRHSGITVSETAYLFNSSTKPRLRRDVRRGRARNTEVFILIACGKGNENKKETGEKQLLSIMMGKEQTSLWHYGSDWTTGSKKSRITLVGQGSAIALFSRTWFAAFAQGLGMRSLVSDSRTNST